MKKIITGILCISFMYLNANAKIASGSISWDSSKNNILKVITEDQISKRDVFKRQGKFVDCLDKEINTEIIENGISYLVVDNNSIRKNLDRAETLCTSNVTDMKNLFANNKIFNQDISKWDVSNVTNMSNMFFRATSFNQPIGNWLVFNVETMEDMFAEANSFNQDISSWDVSNVENMSGMFRNTNNFNQPLNEWNTRRVKSTAYMFYESKAFNQPLNEWNTRNIKYMGAMFKYTENFKQDLTAWDVSSVIDYAQFIYKEENNLPKFN